MPLRVATPEKGSNVKGIYIYGRGLGYSYLKKCIRSDARIIAYIDNYAEEGTTYDGRPVIDKCKIRNEYHYIVISIMNYEQIKEELLRTGIPEDRIICFFCYEDAENERFAEVIDPYRWKTELLWRYMREVAQPIINNQIYETDADNLRRNKEIPHVLTVEETIDQIISGRKSLVRCGDGEFEIIHNRNRPRFQHVNHMLADRLREILKADDDRIVIAIADNYGNLNQYTTEAAAGIRFYLKPDVRKEHMQLLDMSRTYGNAYLSRPYFMYRNKDSKAMKEKFEHLKKIWRGQDVLIVEGNHTRFGVGNDLLEGIASVKRVLVPDKDAFDHYDEILRTVKDLAFGRLTMSIIGPTATVLSYDLAMEGYRAIDIGQVDTEYEWFLRGAESRCDIPYKTSSEYVDKNIFADMPEEMAAKYKKEVAATVAVNK